MQVETSSGKSVAGFAALECEDLSLSYGNKLILQHLDLRLDRGEFLSIVGPSGGGKSTLLRCLTLLDRPSSGKIRLNGKIVLDGGKVLVRPEFVRRQISLVFQEFNLWPNRTVLGNVTEGLRYVLGVNKSEAIDQARHWLNRCGVVATEASYPYMLSGGQKQRVALSRALAMQAQMLLLDEITSQLDVLTTANLLDLLGSLRDGNRSIIFVTHHLKFAKRNTDRAAILINGRIVEEGEARSILANPTHELSRAFLARIQEVW